MWGLPGPGIEPVSLALAGRFFTTEPKRKPHKLFFFFFNEYKRNVQVGDSELSVYWNYRAPPFILKNLYPPYHVLIPLVVQMVRSLPAMREARL